MITIRIKTPVGKKLGLSNFALYPHCPFLWPSHEGPSLVREFLVLESPHNPHIVKCARRKLPSTLPGTSPGPTEVDERATSRCTTPTPFLRELRTPQL